MLTGQTWLYNADQVRSVSQQRLIKQVGTLDNETIQEIRQALALVLKIN